MRSHDNVLMKFNSVSSLKINTAILHCFVKFCVKKNQEKKCQKGKEK